MARAKERRIRLGKPHRIEATLVPFKDRRGRLRFKIFDGVVREVDPNSPPPGEPPGADEVQSENSKLDDVPPKS